MIKTEITRRATLRMSPRHEIGIKIRPARRGGHRFNNQPRYDLAAYRLQAMFLEPQDYVVPPTVIRSFPLERYAEYDPEIRPTFADADSVIVVRQYWLRNISNPEDVLDADRLPCDPEYARHIGDLNIFTYIIRHLDSNRGNFLISTDADNPRVFAVDNGVAFASEASESGGEWSKLRVRRVSSATIERLRGITEEDLRASLAVVAQFRIENEQLVQTEPTTPMKRSRGVHQRGGTVQLGLTSSEISRVDKRIRALIRFYDKGRLEPLSEPGRGPEICQERDRP